MIYDHRPLRYLKKKVREKYRHIRQLNLETNHEIDASIKDEQHLLHRAKDHVQIYIGGLDYCTTAIRVVKYFESCWNLFRKDKNDVQHKIPKKCIVRLELMKDPKIRNRSKGYGFALLSSEVAFRHLLKLSQKRKLVLDGRQLQINQSKKLVIIDPHHLPPLSMIPNIQVQVGNFTDGASSAMLIQFQSEQSTSELRVASQFMKIFEIPFVFNQKKYKVSISFKFIEKI